jgi:hypothetical protein
MILVSVHMNSTMMRMLRWILLAACFSYVMTDLVLDPEDGGDILYRMLVLIRTTGR